MAALSLEEKGSEQVTSLNQNDTTPKKKKEAYPNAYSSLPSAAPPLSFSPFTPRTHPSNCNNSTPVTPFTPEYLKNRDVPMLDTSNKLKKMKIQESFGSTDETPEGVGRYLMITDIPTDTTDNEVRDLIEGIAPYKMILVKFLKRRGTIMVVFHDTREALKMYLQLHTGPVALRQGGPLVVLHCLKIDRQMVISCMSQLEQADVQWDHSEGVVQVSIVGGYPITSDLLKHCLARLGEVSRVDQVGHEGRHFIAEYYDARCAEQAIKHLDGGRAGNAMLLVTYSSSRSDAQFTQQASSLRQPENFTLGSASYEKRGAVLTNRSSLAGSSTSTDPFGYGSTASSWSSQPQGASQATLARIRGDGDLLTPRTSPSIHSSSRAPSISGSKLSEYGWNRDDAQCQYESPPHMLALGRRLGEPGTVQDLVSKADITARARQHQGLGGYWNGNDPKAIPERNRVFPERILSGLDMRTTVMIKDVPNKLSRQELINILAEVVPGEFDFVYLRFDFKNYCNVGYAFVNFCSVKALYQFILAKVGKKWNLFSSEKILQMSYADIQGKAALINKFRNSAVMGVMDIWRPQLFYSSGSMKGKPEPFPVPDNLAIRQRSTAAQLSTFASPSGGVYGLEDNQPYDYTSAAFDPAYAY